MKNSTNFAVETATYSGDSLIPEISGSGGEILVSIESSMCEDENNQDTTVIRIDGKIYHPETIKQILEEFEKHQQRIKN